MASNLGMPQLTLSHLSGKPTNRDLAVERETTQSFVRISRLRAFGSKVVLYYSQSDAIFRKEFYDQKNLFCVGCIDGSSPCSAGTGETAGVRSTDAVRSAREPDYRERKRILLVCK